MNILKWAVIISFFLTSQWTHSSTVAPETDADFAMLPPYCKARASEEKTASYQQWFNRLGSDFTYINHYCAGLHIINQNNKFFDKKEREAAVNLAIREMQYVEQHASSTFGLLPRISYDIGQLYEKMDNMEEAMKAYQYSIKLNPKLPIPYAALSDLFKKKKDNQMALTILEEGLKYKPTSKALLKRMAVMTKENRS